MQMNGKCSEVFPIERSIRQGCSLSPLLYILTLEPLLQRLRDEKTSPALHYIPFAGPLLAKVSRYADDITVFVFCYLDILAMKKAVVKYKQIAGAKINFDKSEGLCLKGWCFSARAFPLEQWTHPHPRGLVWAGALTGAKLVGSTDQCRCPGGYLASKAFALKGQGRGVRHVHLPHDPLLIVLPLTSWHFNNLSTSYFGEAEGRWSVDRFVVNIRGMGV